MLPDTTPQLTPEQIANLEQARTAIPKIREQLRKAKAAGLDVSAQEAELEAQSNQLDKLYRTYVRNIGTITTSK